MFYQLENKPLLYSYDQNSRDYAYINPLPGQNFGTEAITIIPDGAIAIEKSQDGLDSRLSGHNGGFLSEKTKAPQRD